MASYFKLRSNLSRPTCPHKTDYFCLDATGLSTLHDYADGFLYLSPVPGKELRAKYPNAELVVPFGAEPCGAEEYAQVHARYVAAEAKRKAEEEALRQLRKGMARNQHAAEEAEQEAAPVAAPALTLEAPAFLSDFTVLDFETAKEQPIELAAVRYQNWQEVGRLVSFVALPAGEFVPSMITQLTGITTGMLKGAPSVHEVLTQFKALAGGSVLVAHNVSYDRRILEAARTGLGAQKPLPNSWLCTLTVAKARYEGSCKLGELCARFGIANAGAHRALADVLMTYQLLERMHQQQPVAADLLGVTSAAKAKRAASSPSLFAAA